MSEAEQAREPQRDKEGRLLAGRYRLGEVLGRGGMGTVWRAADETLGRTVAVKELRFPSAIDEDEKRRLITRTLREAKAIARIRNTSAVTVYDVVDEDDRPWIVMELIEGKSLAEAIREDGVLTPRRAAEVGLAILDVLRSAHREGILHRDVKPSNVLIAEDGRVVLTDFGIAQVEGDPSVTSTGMLVGAPSYISPERARGHKPGPPADLWSLGGLLYACVEGCPPYDKGSAIATLTAVMTEPVDPPKNAGPLTEVIYGLLTRDPEQRLDDAGARVLLNAVINAPEVPPAPPADATQIMALPIPGAKSTDKGGKGSGRKKAAGAAAAGAAGAGFASGPAGAGTSGTGAAQAPAAGAGAAAGSGALPGAGGGAAAGPANGFGTGSGRGAAGTGSGSGTGIGESTRERLRGALRSARNAKSPAVTATTAAVSGPATPRPAGTPASTRASITDVVPRRTLAIIAGVVVLAVLGTVLALTLGGDDEDSASGGGSKGDTVSSAGADGGDTGGGSGKGDESGGAETDGGGQKDGQKGGQGQETGEATDGASPSASVTADPAEDGVPDGYKKVTDTRFHFTMALPENFARNGIAGSNSGGIYNADGGFPRVQVDYNSSPGTDAAAAWRGLRGAVAGSSSGYKHIGIDKVDYNGYPTVADWEFVRTQKGMRVRVLNRGFKVDATHGYSIMISCEESEWDGAECAKLRQTAFGTFAPTD